MLSEFGRMILSLSLVLGLLWVIARAGRGRRAGGGRLSRMTQGNAGPRIEMLGRRSVGRHSAILVVKVAGRTMIVGQTSQQITLLAEGEVATTAEGDEDPPVALAEDPMPRLALEGGAETPKAWDALIDRLREMTVRH